MLTYEATRVNGRQTDLTTFKDYQRVFIEVQHIYTLRPILTYS